MRKEETAITLMIIKNLKTLFTLNNSYSKWCYCSSSSCAKCKSNKDPTIKVWCNLL